MEGNQFLGSKCVETKVHHSYTFVVHILIEILFSRPINVLQIFELLFHGRICYEYWWIMLLYVLTLYVITI
jgi:hypothetical protein